MIKSLSNWLDDRTGYRGFVRAMLYEHIPGGAKWRYVWGSTLIFAFSVQVITGIFLWMAYSPSSQTAWESVYYIQNEMSGGWLLRGLHHYTAQVMIVLLALHVLQVVIDGAYRAPREVNFWIGIILLKITLGLSLTGYLLPWDQKGYWATKVATNIAGTTPFIGPELQKLVIGGSEYGHHTLTRFFALHAGVLPALLIFFIVAHVYVFRRHGITAHKPGAREPNYFWPDQVLRDGVAILGVLCVVLFLILQHWISAKLSGGDMTQVHLGADLGPPAQPTEPYDAARPEWYFLSLYQLLKYVPEHVGAFIIPGAAMGVLCLMPIVGRWKVGHFFNITFTVIVLAGAVTLTSMAIKDDRGNSLYNDAVVYAKEQQERASVLVEANGGIPVEGALDLMHDDPKIVGPALFRKNCAACHRYDGHDGTGHIPIDDATKEPIEPSAADLAGFASREWLATFLNPEKIVSNHVWGGTRFVGKEPDGKKSRMVKFVTERVAKYDDDARKDLEIGIIALSAEAKLPAQRVADAEAAKKGLIEKGKELIELRLSCADCHEAITPDPSADAPSLIGYGSKEWLVKFLYDPTHGKFYADSNDRMPAYGKNAIMSKREIELLADWLRGDYYNPDDKASTWPWSSPQVGWFDKPIDTTVKIVDPKAGASPAPTDAPPPDKPDTTTPPDKTSPFDPTPTTPKPKPVSPFDEPDVAPVDPKTAGPKTVPDTVDFVMHVKPILEANCVKCHGPEKPKGKLRMDTKESAFKPGSSDDAPIVPGQSAKSLWVQLITEPDEELRMPPKGGPLTQVQIDVIKKWIDQGANWPDGVELKAAATK